MTKRVRTLLNHAAWLVLLVLLGLAWMRAYPHVQFLLDGPGTPYGWDFKAVCDGLDAARAGQDPYRIPGADYVMSYPLLHAFVLQPLCWTPMQPLAYGIVYAVIAVFGWFMLWPLLPASAWDRAAALVALFVSFKAFEWEMVTGNVVILELPLAALTLRLIHGNKPLWAGVAFGTMASLKLLPLIGILGFLALPGSLAARAKPVISALAALVALQLANALLFQRWLPSYLRFVVGMWPGSGAGEPGGQYNQNTIDFIRDGLQTLGIGHPLPEFLLLCLGLGLGIGLAAACVARDPLARLPAATAFSLAVLVLWLLLFRQKNYAFMTFIPLMLVAGFGIGRWIAYLAMLGAVLPAALLASHVVRSAVLWEYNQVWAAWTAVLVLLAGAVLRARLLPRMLVFSP